MAYIESHQSLPRHPKTMRAVELLKMDRHKFLGHINCMWLWALDYADIDGNLPPTVTAETLAAGADLPRSMAERWSSALLRAGGDGRPGFVEWSGDHYILHDWYDFAGRLIDKRVSNRERMRAARVPHVQRTDDAQTTHVQGPGVFLSQGTVPNRTQPSPSTEHTPLPPTVTGGGEVFTKWEKEIGMLTPDIAEKVGWLIDEQGEARVTEAIKIAVEANARNFRYIDGIFKRAGKGPLELPRRLPQGDTGGGQCHVRQPSEFRRGRDAELLDGHDRLRAEAKAAGFDSVPAYVQHLDELRIQENQTEDDESAGANVAAQKEVRM